MTLILTAAKLRPELPPLLRELLDSVPDPVVLCYGEAVYGLRQGPPHPRGTFLALAPEARARGCELPPEIRLVGYEEAVDLLAESEKEISCL